MRKGKRNFKRRISRFLAAVMTVGVMAGCNVGVLTPRAAATAQRLVQVAAAEVGYHEKASNSSLDDKTANSGYNDFTKYARDLGVGNGAPWCAYFVWWCMQTAGAPADQYIKTGWVPNITSFYCGKGQYRARGTYIPKAGDVIIFGDSDHVGIVESANASVVNTIEGNSSSQVARRSYSTGNTYIKGYGIVNYTSDNKGPSITDIKVTAQTKDSYTVQCKVKDESGVAFVTFPTWTQKGDQDDLEKYWYDSRSASVGKLQGNTATFTVYKKDHKNEEGVYITHVYATDKNGNMACGGGISIVMDSSAPTISGAAVSNVTEDGYKVSFQAKDQYSKIKAAYCVPYTTDGGMDDVPSDWQTKSRYAVQANGDKYTYEMKITDFDNVRGGYETMIVVYDTYGNCAQCKLDEVAIPEPAKPDDVAEAVGAEAVEVGNELDLENTEAAETETTNTEAATEPTDTEAATESTDTEAATESTDTEAATESTDTEAVAEPTDTEAATESTDTEAAAEPTDTEAATESTDTEVATGSTDIEATDTEVVEVPTNEVITDISVDVDNSTDNSTVNNVTNNTTNNVTNNTTTNNDNATNNLTENNTFNNVTNVYSVPEEGVNYTVENTEPTQMFDNQLYDILVYLYKVALSLYTPEGYEVADWVEEVTDSSSDVPDFEAIMESGAEFSFDTKLGEENVTISISFK